MMSLSTNITFLRISNLYKVSCATKNKLWPSFYQVSKQFGTMPFNLRSMDDEKKVGIEQHFWEEISFVGVIADWFVLFKLAFC